MKDISTQSDLIVSQKIWNFSLSWLYRKWIKTQVQSHAVPQTFLKLMIISNKIIGPHGKQEKEVMKTMWEWKIKVRKNKFESLA